MTLRKRWRSAAIPQRDDFFPRVPWLLRVKRFLRNPVDAKRSDGDTHNG